MSKKLTHDKSLKINCKPTWIVLKRSTKDNKVKLSQETNFYITMNRSFYVIVLVYVSRSDVNIRSKIHFSNSSYHIVTSQMIYNANELVVS